MKKFSPPSGDETFTSDKQKAIPDIDLRYYNHIMNQVPCEAHSVPLLLDSLLQQVEATVDHKDMTESPPPPRVDKLDNILGDYIDDKLQKLGLMSPAAEVGDVFVFSPLFSFVNGKDHKCTGNRARGVSQCLETCYRSFILSVAHFLIHLFIHLLFFSFILLFFLSFFQWLIFSFILSFIDSLSHSFIH